MTAETAETLPAGLRRVLTDLARTPRLLVAVDYDGTLAPIVSDPARAWPLPAAVDALRSLALLPATTAAVISGRALRDLVPLAGLPPEVHLVGSHGSEFDDGVVPDLDEAASELLRNLCEELDRITADAPGVALEIKPASVTVHVRNTEPEVGARVLAAVRSGPARRGGVQVIEGKAVIELAVVQTDKGHALDVLRRRADATGALFAGDDVTDEQAFKRLSGPDVGIKVGDAVSHAKYSVADPSDVAAVLAFLLVERRSWLRTEGDTRG